MTRLLRRLKEHLEWPGPWRFVELLALAIAVAVSVIPGWRAIVFAPIALVSVVLAVNLSKGLTTRGSVTLVLSFQQGVGKRFRAMEVLGRLARSRGELDVIGRTCLSWIVGGGETTPEELRQRIVAAVCAGSRLRFVVQKMCVPLPFFSDSEMETLREHIESVVEASGEIEKDLKGKETHGGTFCLTFTDQQVIQSMARIRDDGSGRGHLIVSLRTRLKTEERAIASGGVSSEEDEEKAPWDPHVLFRLGCSYAKEYDHRCDHMLRKTQRASEYLRELQDRIHEAAADYGRRYGSPLRRDTGTNLARQAIKCFVAGSSLGQYPPPVCVHYIVTRECPRQCPMCRQWQRSEEILSTDKATGILRSLQNFGVGAVILSGGEPLYHKGFFDILRARGGMAVGMITRGVRPGSGTDSPPVAITGEEADQIAEGCSWVQVSIDTFRNDGGNGLWKKSVQAANTLWNALGQRLDRMEVCYTIHRGNVDEVGSLAQDAYEAGLDKGVRIRLKLAHSRNPNAGFLCSVKELDSLRTVLLGLSGNGHHLNTEYLYRILDGQDEKLEDIARGLPVWSAMTRCRKRGFGCLIHQLSWTIDCDGRVYRCCNQFDDNIGPSTHRIPIGSLLQKSVEDVWKGQEGHPAIPVEPESCGRCTRHMHQNVLLNKVWLALEEGKALSLAKTMDPSLPAGPADEWAPGDGGFWV